MSYTILINHLYSLEYEDGNQKALVRKIMNFRMVKCTVEKSTF